VKSWLKLIIIVILSSALYINLTAQDNTITDDQWREDVEALVTSIIRVHPNPFRDISEETFNANANALLEAIPDMSDNEIFVGLMRIVASIQDGHSGIYAAMQSDFTLHYYPLRFYAFADGIYVVDASEDYAEYIGARLISIDDTSADDAFEILRLSATADNPYTQIVTTSIQINVPEILQGAGIMDGDDPDYLLEMPDGERQTLNPTAVDLDTFNTLLPGFLPPQTGDDMLFLSNTNEAFWHRLFEEQRTFYLVYNMVRSISNSGLRMRGVVEEIETLVAEDAIDRVIIDLRNNPGGNESHSQPLSHYLSNEPFFQEDGRLLILTGPRTFSAAVVFSLRVEAETPVAFIGEPTGGRPLMFENNSQGALEHSLIRYRISTRARFDVPEDDTRLAIEPAVPVPWLASDYFAGVDATLTTALEY